MLWISFTLAGSERLVDQPAPSSDQQAPQKTQAQQNLRGILAMMLAMMLFVANDALIKTVRVEWEAGQILVVRGVFAFTFIALWLSITKGWVPIPRAGRGKVLARAGLETIIAIAFITALGMMALADITAVLMLAPLLITAISRIFFGEIIGWRRWSAVWVGFFGMLLVVQPGWKLSSLGLALAFASVLGVAWRDLLTRTIPQGFPGGVITLTTTLGTLTGGVLLSLFGMPWRPFTLEIVLILAGAAVLVAVGNHAIIIACRDVELSVVSPFRYSVILWALLFGALLFGDLPNMLAFAGIGLIVASGLYTLHRERIRQREPNPPSL
jgi:drug/metabolite transporter (DMT)-like permease